MKRYAAQTGRLCQGRSEGFSPEGRQGVRETDPVGWAHRAAFLGEVGSTKVDEDSKMGFTGCGGSANGPRWLQG